MQYFSAQSSILALVIALCVVALVRIIQVVSKANILVNVRLLNGRFQVVISIFDIVLLWQRKQSRIVDIL